MLAAQLDEALDRHNRVRYGLGICSGIVVCLALIGYFFVNLPFLIASGVILFLMGAYMLIDASMAHLRNQQLLPPPPAVEQEAEVVNINFDDLIVEYTTDNNDMCAICHEIDGVMAVLPCGHKFHAPCLKQWFARKIVCPICNSDPIATILFDGILVDEEESVAAS